MRDFAGKLAVVTGGGTGMGRELVRQLVAEGASVAMCDLFADAMAETTRLCEADGVTQGARITSHVVDVGDEAQVIRFAAEVARDHATDHIHLLFNNAGIGGGGSFVLDDRAEWDRVFQICWFGVYYSCRAFFPMLERAAEGHIVNTSSANGFWAALMPGVSQTAYSAAKFAVKGFTEGLVTDLRNYAPHIKASIVMPGGVGTPIGLNSRRVLSGEGMTEVTRRKLRQHLKAIGMPGGEDMDDAALEAAQQMLARRFEELAPTSAAQAATIILDGVKADRWRIIVGDDATRLDRRVRAEPERAYDPDFVAYAAD
ncbi:SDR family NAD(P)-dependent oxidoreductase [Sphingomonas jeddahensis]|uniref:Putative oxidoreductase SadH n=1 Tax=Sphingomonas jeddahensis TaxID=1915074 RepID=A0A1V2ETY8_9SPHN|nr:SDR family NAD(P)-dependent oxidoreductase [Sphingomonas jeddahensis]ONF96060.1 putative oxidoreductase SadH [Sphingomonas jeddahensis]